ncbi:MAG: ABC transporter permease [Bacteroidota bacterium]|nr:ABC transporter permease [Bacteroidota bacterium]
MQIQVYSATGKSNLWRTLKAIGKEFPVAHALGFRFAERNIRARYRQSLLGIVWALIPPLATAGIWIFLNQKNIVTLNHTGSNYALFVITGTMLWSVFSNAVTMPIQSIQANAPILVKVNFPREALMITAFYEIVFTSLISLMIIVAEILIFQIPVTGYTFLFIPAVFILIMLGMCFGLLLLPFAILYKDIQFALPTFLQIAMYATPVVYATTELSGVFRIFTFNPVSPVLVSARDWILGLQSTTGLLTLGCIGLVTIVILVAGFILQRIAMEILIERMGT